MVLCNRIQNHTQQLQAQIRELERQCNPLRRLREEEESTSVVSKSEALQRLENLQNTRDVLMRENSILRKRRDEYLKWEIALGLQVDRYLGTEEPVQALIEHRPEDLARRQSEKRRWILRQPLTVEECCAMAQLMYSEIPAFNESEHFVSTGSSVLGWTDRRHVENGLLKFSLQKVFPNRSAYELMMQSWAVMSSPEANERLYSEAMKMRCELVQRVDPSNFLLYQEYEAHDIDSRTGQSVLTIGRRLVLNTIFETEKGYITLFHSMDPHRLADWPEACDPVPLGASVDNETTPTFRWTSFDRVGLTGEDCRVNYVGGVHKQNTSRGFWAIEVLLLVLRWEGFVIGPNLVLQSQADHAM